MPPKRTYKRQRKLTRRAAISDDEMSDVGGDIAPVSGARAKSKWVDYTDDVGDTKSETSIPEVSGDLNGDADANNEDDEDDDNLETDEYVSRH